MKKLVLILIIPFFISCSKDDDISADEQLAIDEKIIDSYLSENEIDADEHFSGIRYLVHEEGSGEVPDLNSKIYAKISSRFLDGSSFYQSQEGEILLMNNLIDALKFMIPEMKEGGRITIYSPSAYCFGRNSSDLVPANSILIFDIELLSVINSEEEQLEIETSKIDKYLETKEIEAQIHESGIRYVHEMNGIGVNPTTSSNISVKYKGYFFNESVFDQNESGVTFPLNDLVEAWRIMIPLMKVNDKMTIYAPSKYCYGENGTGPIPPNTQLIFEIELISFQ